MGLGEIVELLSSQNKEDLIYGSIVFFVTFVLVTGCLILGWARPGEE